jgi:UDP-2,4-diacetamido-2,4,6-trideoxy-beta-L-altropyranose hydrolase
MVTRQLAIRVDAGTHLGMGHLMRCYSVSQVLPQHFVPHFYLLETDEPVRAFLEKNNLRFTFLPRTSDETLDAAQFLASIDRTSEVLLDSYALQSKWQKEIKKHGHLLYVIDDLHAWHHVADHVINHSGGVKAEDYSCEDYTQLHLGYAYRMLRPAFMKGPAQRTRPLQFPGSILISMGASDVPNNTLKLAQACLELEELQEINLLVSRLNPHFDEIKAWTCKHQNTARLHEDLDETALYALMSQCDTLICPASTIALEGCSVGMIVMAGVTAENQRDNYNGLVEGNLTYPLGYLNDTLRTDLLTKCQLITKNDATLLLNSQVSKFSSTTIKIQQIFEQIPQLRSANHEDLSLLYDWANDELVRLNSFQKDKIDFSEHETWFNKKINNDNSHILILHIGKMNMGVIRFEIDKTTAIINYSVDTNYRGQGLGRLLLQLGEEYLKERCEFVTQLIGHVKPNNIASIKSFEGYEKTMENNHIVFIKMIHKSIS